MTTFRWGTVTDDSPLLIRLDGPPGEPDLPIADSLIDPATLVLGDRLRCEQDGRRLIVHGRSGGGADRVPVGTVIATVKLVEPLGWKFANGQALSRTGFPDLFADCNPVVGNPTVTIATPGVFTLTGHGMQTGQMVYLTTTGALPTGLSANTAYFVIRTSSSQFRLATSLANANAGTAINTTGSQSGTHTIRRTYGVGNGSTTFNVPIIDGRTIVGLDTTQAEFAAPGITGGAKTHTLTTAELAAHQHTQRYSNHSVAAGGGSSIGGMTGSGGQVGGTTSEQTTLSAGGGGAHNNLQPYIALPALIKT